MIEEGLMLGWECLCAERLGRIVPPNTIEFDEDSAHGSISYVVAHGAPPLKLTDGNFVRGLSLYYDYKEVQHGNRH